MASVERVVEIDVLERRLLPASSDSSGAEGEEDTILYSASFEEMEESFVRYQTAQWVLYSLLLVLAWGIGLLMLLYVPVRRYVLRQDFRSRRLYLTSNAIVYKMSPSKSLRSPTLFSPGDLIMQKLEEVGSSVKRVENLIEKRQTHTSKPLL